MFLASQPDLHINIDTHTYDLSLLSSVFYDLCQALSTTGVFLVGVGVKYVVKYGHYEGGSRCVV